MIGEKTTQKQTFSVLDLILKTGRMLMSINRYPGRPQVTDHLMPGLTGAEFAQIVRFTWQLMRLPIISGYA